MEFLTFNIFKVFLGLDYINHPSDVIKNIVITKDDSYNELACRSNSIIEAEPLSLLSYEFLNMPIEIIKSCNNVPDILNTFQPVMKGNTIRFNNHVIETDIDVFGLIFFMLSRVEELDRSKLDSHGRFAATSSKAYQHGFLERPIVDEYVEFLWCLMKYLWPELERKENHPEIIVGCDVDIPYDCSTKSLKKIIRSSAGDILKRKSFTLPITRLIRYLKYKIDNEVSLIYDKNYTFDWYMDVVEKAGLKATFFFIADGTDGKSGCYDINEKIIKSLISNIIERGHNIGLHGSYDSYNDFEMMFFQKLKLEQVIRSLGFSNSIELSRQHYLRWDVNVTPDYLNEIGIKIDYSGGYADHSGFRYGTGKLFNSFSLTKNSIIDLKIQPLIIMEGSIFGYQKKPYNLSTRNYMEELKNKSLEYGNFSLLWHNSHFYKKKDKEFFLFLIQKNLIGLLTSGY